MGRRLHLVAWQRSAGSDRLPFVNMTRIIANGLFILWSTVGNAQDDRIFPNISAQFDLAWPCIDPSNGPWTAFDGYTFEAEPHVTMLDLDWGRLLQGANELGLVAVDGERILYHGSDGSYVEAGLMVQIYDFALEVGDTAYWDAYYAFGPTVVSSIDTLNVEGRDRRLFRLDNEDRWLEGIGSLMGFFRPVYETPLGCGDPLFSYCADYRDEMGVEYSVCSDQMLSIEEASSEVPRVHPNPALDAFWIELDADEGSFMMYDALGAIVRRGIITDGSTFVPRSDLAPGMYFLDVNGHRMKVLLQ